MTITFGDAKNAGNIAERDLLFERASDFDWSTALVRDGDRRDYDGMRLCVSALLDGRLHVAVVTPRGENLRVISFRKANAKEVRFYGETAG